MNKHHLLINMLINILARFDKSIYLIYICRSLIMLTSKNQTMRNQLKTRLVLTHVVEYYTNNELVTADTFNEVSKEKLKEYWKRVVEKAKGSDNGCVELEGYCVVVKCVRDYEYSVERIVERVLIDENN